MTFVAVGAPASAAVRKGLGYNSGIVMGRQYYLGEYHIRPYDWPWGNTRVWCIDVDNDIPLDDAVTYTVVNDIAELSKLHEDALAWIAVRDDISDRVSSAAVKLVAHDFMGIPYPGGILNVDTMTAADIGYNASNGDASVMNDREAIIARARQLKAYGLTQAGSYPLPLAITQTGFTQPEPGVGGLSYWSVNAANGRGVPGVYLLLNADNSSAASQVSYGWSTSTTGADGVAELRFTPLAPGEVRITVTGLWAGLANFLIPQGVPTQRGLGVSLAAGSAEFAYTAVTPSPTTTTTAPATTTTTVAPTITTTTVVPTTSTTTTVIPSPTTTTTKPATTTTMIVVPQSTTTTTVPTSSTTTTTAPATTTTTTLVEQGTTTTIVNDTTTTVRPSPTTTLPGSVKGQQLARTGTTTWAVVASALMALGGGFIVLGGLNVAERRRPFPR